MRPSISDTICRRSPLGAFRKEESLKELRDIEDSRADDIARRCARKYTFYLPPMEAKR